MLRRTWSITKGSLGRIRRRTSADESGFDDKESGNEHHHVDAGKYFNFRLRHFRKSIISPPTFYLDENNRDNGVADVQPDNNSIAREAIYTNSQYSSDDLSRTIGGSGGGTDIGELPAILRFSFLASPSCGKILSSAERASNSDE